MSVDCVIFLQLEALDSLARLAAEGARSGGVEKFGIWIWGRIFLSFWRVVCAGALTTASIALLTEGRSRSLRARTRSSRSLRRGLPFLPRDFGRLIGPLHSVVMVARVGLTSKSKSLDDLMLGAILGVTLRSWPSWSETIVSILLGSCLSRSGLFGGGGPGLSERLLDGYVDARLEARCIKTG